MKLFSILRFHADDNGLKRNYSLLKRFFCNKAKEKPKSTEKWNSVIGLEIHAQILTDSKLFSGASTKYGSAVNTCVSFFDCATPGTLPVLNRKCVEASVITALALNCYQITQQRQPVAVGGELKFHVFTPGVHKEPYPKSSKLKQIQLEQDSGKTLHDNIGKKSLIDLNRAGVGLMEFVFEPDLSDGEEAAALVKELVLILRRLNACSCRMAEGALRVDANISINKPNEPLGVRTEVKNISSVRGVASAINYEIKRQIKARENGEIIVNETRAWDVETGKTVPMRDKEDKLDYRFMPEPNLPPLHIHLDKNSRNEHNLVDAIFLQTQIPELPQETRDKLTAKYNLHKSLVIVLVNEPILLELFTKIFDENEKRSPALIAKFLIYHVLTFLYKNDLDVEYCYTIYPHLGELVDLLEAGSVSLVVAFKILGEILKNPQKLPKQIMVENNWDQINDEEELRKICKKVLDEYPNLVKQYKNGKKKLYKYFMGQIVKASNTKANMSKVDKILSKMLE